MKLSTLIERLREVEAQHGDVPVVIGEVNGRFVATLDVNVQPSNWVLGDADDESPVAIVQGYAARA